jgi:hypothetical protein
LATATLRGILVVAAVVLGIFVLSRAFPTGNTGPDVRPAEEASPTDDQTPKGEETAGGGGTNTPSGKKTNEPCPKAGEFPEMQVLNGTDETGLAAAVAQRLEGDGYRIAVVSNANRSDYERTVVLTKKNAEALGTCLLEDEFPRAQLEGVAPDAEYELSVILGPDASRGN